MSKDRSEYNSLYYKQNRERLNEKAKARYHAKKNAKKIEAELPKNVVSQN